MANFNLNKCVMAGRLTADVELKQTPSGVSVCTFTVAVTRKINREETDFISCVAWRNTAEFISRYFHKGSSICVTGSIQTRNWTDNYGNKRYSTELIVDEAFFVDSKSENAPTYGQQNTSQSESIPIYGQQNAPHFEELSTEDDLPF